MYQSNEMAALGEHLSAIMEELGAQPETSAQHRYLTIRKELLETQYDLAELKHHHLMLAQVVTTLGRLVLAGNHGK